MLRLKALGMELEGGVGMYRHVVSASDDQFTVWALVGARAAVLAWDHVGPASDRQDLLGFAIHRFDETANRDSCLQGQKRFVGQEDLGVNLESRIAPFQRFRWGDRYASALVVLRIALEHHLMDRLIFLSRLYLETYGGIKKEDVLSRSRWPA